jgi:hypothetical protein
MAKKRDELFPAAEDETEALEEFDRLLGLLFERINAFAEEENISDHILPLLVLQTSATLRMGSYIMTTVKPSAGGLKLDLDRFRREADDLIREMKKDAERFVDESKRRLAELEADDDERDE